MNNKAARIWKSPDPEVGSLGSLPGPVLHSLCDIPIAFLEPIFHACKFRDRTLWPKLL
jgi:hypothetical protein